MKVFILMSVYTPAQAIHNSLAASCTFVRTPPSAGNTPSHLPSSLASTSPNWLPLVFSGSMYVWIALTLLLWVTHLCSVLPWGPCWLPLFNVLVDMWNLVSLTRDQIHGQCVRSMESYPLGHPSSFLSSWTPGRDKFSLCHHPGTLHRTCDYKCLLNECSNSSVIDPKCLKLWH